MKIAVIGGGINGLCISWEAAKRGAQVTLFERNHLMKETSSHSSKLIHGGLRYLENFDFKLVKEALNERAWWIENVPHLVKPLEFHLPLYRNSKRLKMKYSVGLSLYDLFAGEKNIGNHSYLSGENFHRLNPQLNQNGLLGGFVFFDAQMDDYALGMWVAGNAKKLGVDIKERHTVLQVKPNGEFTYKRNINQGVNEKFVIDCKVLSSSCDYVINATGNYVEDLLLKSKIHSNVRLEHVRGSHLITDRKLKHGYFLEVPRDRRFIFVLPYKGKTLVGTTEIKQPLTENIQCSEKEQDYLITAYNHYFNHKLVQSDIVENYAGMRPLIKSKKVFSNSSRKDHIQVNDRLVTVFGGKWTIARALAKRLSTNIGL